jgi:regulator of protease activity HflC (stomatin/prohibitin superfamily)
MTLDKDQKILNLEQKIEQQKQKKRQLEARKQAAEARENDRIKKQNRKDDTRIKILLGSYLKKKMDNDEQLNSKVLDELEQYLTADRDRLLFGLSRLDD